MQSLPDHNYSTAGSSIIQTVEKIKEVPVYIEKIVEVEKVIERPVASVIEMKSGVIVPEPKYAYLWK